jgi:putative nucleotidyltransferase with HDIG domain
VIAGWTPEHTRRSKEVLYRCLERIESTKAALYLLGDGGAFELVTAYGFGRRDSVAATIETGHPLWDWIRRHRTNAAFGNEPEGGPLAVYLEQAGTSRILTVPLAAAGELVGFIDARDKARRAPFAGEDVAAAREIGRAVETLLAEYSLYGAAMPEGEQVPATFFPPVAAPGAAGPALHSSALAGLASLLRTLATLPEISAVALTVSDGVAPHTSAWVSQPLEQTQRDAIVRHQSDALLRHKSPAPDASRWIWSEAIDAPRPLRAETVHTTVMHAAGPTAIVLSVLTPARSTAWQAVAAAAAQHLAVATSLRTYRLAARNLARSLLEPGETSYPHLRQHSQSVSELAQRLAVALGLSADEEELVTVAAYLHDVGMRELDYTRVYRMPRPGDAEKRVYRRHPVVGARIVDSAMFPGDLAGAIRHHHERWDGDGYPQQLVGSNIPLASRIIHLAEVWDTLISPSSYRPAMPRDAALTAIRGEAGKQFDPDLVPIFEELVGG